MSMRLDFVGGSGMSIVATLERLADGAYLYNGDDPPVVFATGLVYSEKRLTFLAGTGENTGYYYLTLETDNYDNGLYLYKVHNEAVSNVTIGAHTFYVKQGQDLAYYGENEVYYADINFVRGSSSDKYIVAWYKNGQRITDNDDIASATLSVFKTDGTTLFNGSSLTEFFDEFGGGVLTASGSNRQTRGEVYIAVASAIIDGATRTYSWVLGRDT